MTDPPATVSESRIDSTIVRNGNEPGTTQSLLRKTANDFIFVKLLGEGSFANVFLAVDVKNHKNIYAIKVCQKRQIIREKKMEYIHREKRTMLLLNNVAGFVNLSYSFHDISFLFFVMTYAKNGNLLQFLNKSNTKTLKLDLARHYAAEILLACEEMHRRNIVHRDLKPENILLDGEMHTMIADFGSAKILTADEMDFSDKLLKKVRMKNDEGVLKAEEQTVSLNDVNYTEDGRKDHDSCLKCPTRIKREKYSKHYLQVKEKCNDLSQESLLDYNSNGTSGVATKNKGNSFNSKSIMYSVQQKSRISPVLSEEGISGHEEGAFTISQSAEGLSPSFDEGSLKQRLIEAKAAFLHDVDSSCETNLAFLKHKVVPKENLLHHIECSEDSHPHKSSNSCNETIQPKENSCSLLIVQKSNVLTSPIDSICSRVHSEKPFFRVASLPHLKNQTILLKDSTNKESLCSNTPPADSPLMFPSKQVPILNSSLKRPCKEQTMQPTIKQEKQSSEDIKNHLEANSKLKLNNREISVNSDEDSENPENSCRPPRNRRKVFGSFVGTPQYVSPEVLQSEPVTPMADLWALGCIIYQLLSGKTPFRGGKTVSLFKEILARNLEFPEDIDLDAKDLVQKLLQTNPEDRLGALDETGNYQSIRSHPFFKSIDFTKVRCQSPPGVVMNDLEKNKQDLPENLNEIEPGFDDKQINRLFGMEFWFDLQNKANTLTLEESEASESEIFPPSEESKNTSVEKPSFINPLTLSTEEKEYLLKIQKSNKWHQYTDGELILKKGFLYKKKGLFPRKRMFLLTTGPRLIYVDPFQMVKKGEIPWSPELKVEAINFKNFFVHTPNRTYNLEAPEGMSPEWIKAIQGMYNITYSEQANKENKKTY